MVPLLVGLLLSQHLEPERGPFSDDLGIDYEVAAGRLLLTDSRRECQLVLLPSFAAEEAVYITRASDGTAQVVTARVKGQLWGELQSWLRKQSKGREVVESSASWRRALDALKIDVDRATAPISPAVADELRLTWHAALMDTRHADVERLGLDGTTYSFAQWERGFGYRSGRTWSPKSSHLTGHIALGNALIALARSDVRDRPRREKELAAEARDVRALLNREPERAAPP